MKLQSNSMNRINPNMKQMKLVTEAYNNIQSLTPADVTRDAVYDAYDELVDEFVYLTDGKALAIDSDPLTYNRDKKRRFFGLTYNEMAEILGKEAFGE